MRLQLSPSQISSFAATVGPVGSLNVAGGVEGVLRVFRDRGHDPFTRKDLTAVIVAAGSRKDFDKDHDAYVEMTTAIKLAATSTENKGFYTLKGSNSSPPPSRFAPPPAVATATAADSSIEIKEVEGVFWSPLLVGTSDEVYNDDAGLRRIAVSQSSCFGNYSTRATVCQNCPLASFCVQASITALPGLVAGLDEATNTNIKNAIAARTRAPSPIDELLGITPKSVETLRPVPATPKALDMSTLPTGASLIPIPIEVVCTGCDHPIPEGSEGVHIPARGLFHIACAQKV